MEGRGDRYLWNRHHFRKRKCGPVERRRGDHNSWRAFTRCQQHAKRKTLLPLPGGIRKKASGAFPVLWRLGELHHGAGAPRRTYAMNEEKNQEPARKRGFLIAQKEGALDIGFPFEIGRCIKNA